MTEGPDDEQRGDGHPATNPERYLLLVRDATGLIDRLVAAYDVERIDGNDLAPEARYRWPGSPATKLVPTGGGAPITFTFTAFPGVMVQYGHRALASFPSCGCDLCDEDPAEGSARLEELLADVIAGGLTETRHRRMLGADAYESDLASHDGRGRQGSTGMLEAEYERVVPIGTTRWAPWVRSAARTPPPPTV